MFLLLFFFYCLLIPGDKVKSINLSRQPCIRFCFCLWFFFYFLTCLQIELASLCACFVCFLVAADDDDVVVVVVLACHFTFYAVAAAAYCLLRVYLRYVFSINVCVCFITKIKIGACVCVYTKNITDILVYIQERTLYGTSVCM